MSIKSTGEHVVGFAATNACVNAAGALDHVFRTGVIARSRSTLCSSIIVVVDPVKLKQV
jgi:hypothetical protein